MIDFRYKPAGEILRQFMEDDSFLRCIRGPVGSGKSVSACVEMFRRACEQQPGTDGIRRTRWAAIRNTNPELRTTTIATWLAWFPEQTFGRFRWSPPFTHHIKIGDIDMEVLFLPLDNPEDIKKLLSLEVTGIWANEARELPKAVIDAATMRVGRYPSMKDGCGPTWHGVLLDTNPPEDDHWLPILSGEAPMPENASEQEILMLQKPPDWKFFNQPPGMIEVFDEQKQLTGYLPNPDAENFQNLPGDYYTKMIQGKTKSWIDVYVMNRPGTTEDGKPVYEGFNETVHLADNLEMIPGREIWVGLDFGLTPAAVFAQQGNLGRWLVLDELVATDMGAVRFAEQLRRRMAERFEGHSFKIYGDPAGDQRAQTDESTPFEILRAAGINAQPAPTNDVIVRTEAVNRVLARMVDGKPGFLIDRARCPVLVAGFKGRYCYRRMNVGHDRYEDKPTKNRYSHPHDAFQYLLCGGGEGRQLVRSANTNKPVVPKRKGSIFERMGIRNRR